LAASIYCAAVALPTVERSRPLDWAIAGASLALTVTPQAFRHYSRFAVACWVAAALIGVGGFVTSLAGGCVYVPAALPLIAAALLATSRGLDATFRQDPT
jgi:hypothetical protein